MPQTPTRRHFLSATATLVPIAALPAAVAQEALLETQKTPDIAASAAQPATPAVDHYTPGYFTADEWAFVNAACDRLIPHDEHGPGAVELGVPQYIDRQMQTPYADGAIWYMQGPFFEAAPEFGYQSQLTPKQQYRLGIRAIDGYCRKTFGKAFAELGPDQQTDTLKQIEAGKIKSDEAPLRTFFSSFLLRNTMEGYFGDPMYGGNKDMGAWKMIGYPGVRADYLEWVDQSRRYPYGPVSIHGQRG
jgi:gluconate 2-dehydrogenase gamma chain